MKLQTATAARFVLNPVFDVSLLVLVCLITLLVGVSGDRLDVTDGVDFGGEAFRTSRQPELVTARSRPRRYGTQAGRGDGARQRPQSTLATGSFSAENSVWVIDRLTLVDTPLLFREKMGTKMFRSVQQDIVIGRRCRWFLIRATRKRKNTSGQFSLAEEASVFEGTTKSGASATRRRHGPVPRVPSQTVSDRLPFQSEVADDSGARRRWRLLSDIPLSDSIEVGDHAQSHRSLLRGDRASLRACRYHSRCQGLDGECCPAADGYMHTCCDGVGAVSISGRNVSFQQFDIASGQPPRQFMSNPSGIDYTLRNVRQNLTATGPSFLGDIESDASTEISGDGDAGDNSFDAFGRSDHTKHQEALMRHLSVSSECVVTDHTNISEVQNRILHLEQLKVEKNEGCPLPPGGRCDTGAAQVRCQGTPEDCSKFEARIDECCAAQMPLDAELLSCDGVINRHLARATGQGVSLADMAVGRGSREVALSLEEQTKVTKARNAKKALLKKQRASRRAEQARFMKSAEEALWRYEKSSNVQLTSLIDRQASKEDDAPGVVSGFGPDGSWPQTLHLSMLVRGVYSEGENANSDMAAADAVNNWTAAWHLVVPMAHAPCPPSKDFCEYVVTIPCDSTLGRGRLLAATTDSNGGVSHPVELDHKIVVLADPWSQGDEFYLPLRPEEQKTLLLDEVGGIWMTNGVPLRWWFSQFSSEALEVTLDLLDMIPARQRRKGPRVLRWLTYLTTQVLDGKWCTPRSCYNDGTPPWSWTGSLKIFKERLATGKTVRYAQCWVFAGVATSIHRALGIGSRMVTNYNSAHGMVRDDQGVDNFYTYDVLLRPVIASPNTQDSIWSFHVWNEVFMRRDDLPDHRGDGWQALDSTPQTDSVSCTATADPEDGGDGDYNVRDKTRCRWMMGPASVRFVKSAGDSGTGGPFEVLRKVPYDSMFLYMETHGVVRNWKPAWLHWETCPETCLATDTGDGNCDDACNVQACDWDMGDCCEETCHQVANMTNITRLWLCGGNGYNCKGRGLGWTLIRKPNTHWVGKGVFAQKLGGMWNEVHDITYENYKARSPSW